MCPVELSKPFGHINELHCFPSCRFCPSPQRIRFINFKSQIPIRPFHRQQFLCVERAQGRWRLVTLKTNWIQLNYS